jgi:hypothetical protein
LALGLLLGGAVLVTGVGATAASEPGTADAFARAVWSAVVAGDAAAFAKLHLDKAWVDEHCPGAWAKAKWDRKAKERDEAFAEGRAGVAAHGPCEVTAVKADAPKKAAKEVEGGSCADVYEEVDKVEVTLKCKDGEYRFKIDDIAVLRGSWRVRDEVKFRF